MTQAHSAPWYKELNSNHWRVLIGCFFGWVFDGYENFSLFLVAAPALRQLLPADQLSHVSTYQGYIVASMLIGVGTGGVLAGVVADYLGRKRTMMLTILIYSVCTGLTGFVHSWQTFAIFRFVAGLGMGGEWATGTTLVAESWPSKVRAKGLGIMQSAFGWGALLASLVWYLLTSYAGPGAWRYVFFLGILPSFFVLYLRRNINESEKWAEKRDERKALQARNRAGEELTRDEKIVAKFTLGMLFSDPQLRRTILLCLMMALGTTIGYWGISTWIPAYLESVATAAHAVNPKKWSGIAGLLFTSGSIVGYIGAGFVADALGRKKMLLFFFGGALIATPMVFLWTHSPQAVAAAACLNGAFTLGQFV